MIRLRIVDHTMDHFVVTSDEPMRIEVSLLGARPAILAHVYHGTEVDRQQDPDVTYDGTERSEMQDMLVRESTLDLRKLAGLDEYNVCSERNAEHDPVIALMQDPEMPKGYVTVECAACHLTTGVAFTMPDPLDIDWG